MKSLLVSILLVAFTCVPCEAQRATDLIRPEPFYNHKLVGTVFDFKKQTPIGFASISFLANGKAVYSSTSDKSGTFTFKLDTSKIDLKSTSLAFWFSGYEQDTIPYEIFNYSKTAHLVKLGQPKVPKVPKDGAPHYKRW